MGKNNTQSNSNFKKILAAMLASLVVAGSFAALPQTYSVAPAVSAAGITTEPTASEPVITVTKDIYDYFIYSYVQNYTDAEGTVVSTNSYELKFDAVKSSNNVKLVGYKTTAGTINAVEIPASFKFEDTTYSVTSIASEGTTAVFASESGVDTITIPDNVTSIKDGDLASAKTIVASIGSTAWDYAIDKEVTFATSFADFTPNTESGKLNTVLEPQDSSAYSYEDDSRDGSPFDFAYKYTTDDGEYRVVAGNVNKTDDGKGTITAGSDEEATAVKAENIKIQKLNEEGKWNDESITVKASLSLSGTVTAKYTIVSGDISKGTLTYDETAAYDNGKEVAAPNLKVVLGEGDNTYELKAESDYYVEYYDNTDVGTARFTVTGNESTDNNKKIYGSKSGKFDIVAYTISESDVEAVADQTYSDGAAVEPEIKVKNPLAADTAGDEEKYLEKDKDYTVEYKNNINVGRATAIITGKGNFATEEPIEITFKVTPKEIIGIVTKETSATDAKPYVAIAGEYTYTGEKINPTEVTVSLKLKDAEGNDQLVALEEGKDYTLSYGTSLTTNINKGTGYVYVNFIGNYKLADNATSTANRASFTIKAASIEDLTVTVDDIAFGETPTPVVKLGAVEIPATANTKKANYTVTYDDGQTTPSDTAGEHSVTISVPETNGSGNIAATGEVTSKTVKYNVAQAVMSAANTEVTLSATTLAYSGKELKPTITVKVGETALAANTDYTVTYENNINVGTAKVTIEGTGNKFTGTITKTFQIKPKKVTSVNATFNKAAYTGEKIEPEFTLSGSYVEGTDYDVAYFNNKAAGSDAYVLFQFKGNYAGAVAKYFTIDKFDLTAEGNADKVTVPEKTFTVGAEVAPEVKLNDVTLTEGVDYEVLYDNDANKEGTHEYIVKFSQDNFTTTSTNEDGTTTEEVTKTFKYTIEAEQQELVNTSTLSSETVEFGDTITIQGSAEGGKGGYQYRFAAKHIGTDTSYKTLKSLNETDSMVWRPTKGGTYSVLVRVIDADGNEQLKAFTLTVNAPELENTSKIVYRDDTDVETYEINKGETVRLTGAAEGGSTGYTYRFAAQHETDAKGTLLQDTGTKAYKDWTPRKTGTYTVWVRVTDKAGVSNVKAFTLIVK